MKFAALVSGGKDSIYSIQECINNGHYLVCCIHLEAPRSIEEESFMYQTAGSNVLSVLVQECLGVPLILHRRKGKSLNISMVYQNNDSEEDEVEDLYVAIKNALDQFPEVNAVSSGAILSNYQRVRVEHVCSRLGLTSFSYLWRLAPQHELLQRMLGDGIEAVLVKVACPPGLIPSIHLNRTLGSLYYSGLFDKLHERYRFHYCGEGGEYESLVLDCPLFKKRLVLDEVEIEETEDGVGELKITKFHAEDKCDLPVKTLDTKAQEAVPEALRADLPRKARMMRPMRCLPHVKQLSGGLLHLSEMMSPFAAQTSNNEAEADQTVKEALMVFDLLQQTLNTYGCNSHDVVLVHLYLSEISHFQSINQHYRDNFGTLLPPSRSTVAVGRNMLPGGRRVMLDCIVQIGSGDFMREMASPNMYSKAALQTKTSELRHVLHVQSISHWAPVCVGPYSQVNTIRSGLHFIAGQIGLDPPLMKLKDGWRSQLKQSWTNMARILDSLDGGSLNNLLSCLIYTSAQVDDWSQVAEISRDMVECNGSVLPGAVDSTALLGEQYGGYEDEDTWLEMTKNDTKKGIQIPILVVAVHELPVGASVEVEAFCVTQKAFSCLELQYAFTASESALNPPVFNPSLGWNTGHDFLFEDYLTRPTIRLETATVSIGTGCAAMSTIAAWTSRTEFIDPEIVCSLILDAAITTLKSVRLGLHQMLNIRLYYVACSSDDAASDDGIRWRTSLASSLAAKASFLACNINDKVRMPATSVIPVSGINFIRGEAPDNEPFVAAQVMAIDPVHMETELWIHIGRDPT
jgi:diphthine-ammonia ligase